MSKWNASYNEFIGALCTEYRAAKTENFMEKIKKNENAIREIFDTKIECVLYPNKRSE